MVAQSHRDRDHQAMARVVIPIYFDYASTLCYIAWRIVTELERELDIDPFWKGVAIRLRDRAAAPGRQLGPIEREKILTVIAETGVRVEPPERWLDSSVALQGAELARDAGAFRAYHDSVFRAAFEERADIGQIDVLAAIAARAGMDSARFRDDLESGRMAARLEENRREADSFSALGYPTFLLGDFPLIGIQPIDTMRMLLTRFLDLRRTEAQA